MKKLSTLVMALVFGMCGMSYAQEEIYIRGPYEDMDPVKLSRDGDDGKFHYIPGYDIEFEVEDTPLYIETLSVAKFAHIYKNYDKNLVVSHSLKLVNTNTGEEIRIPGSKQGVNILNRKVHYAVVPALGAIKEPLYPGYYKIELYASAGASSLPNSAVCAELFRHKTVVRIRLTDVPFR